MNYLALIFSIFFIVFIIFSLWEVYINDKKNQLIALSKRPENIPIKLRAYRDTYGITDKEFIKNIPYYLEYKEPNDTWWKSIKMFQKSKDDKYDIQSIVIKDKEDLENWKTKFKSLKDVNDFNERQKTVMREWEEREINKNCMY